MSKRRKAVAAFLAIALVASFSYVFGNQLRQHFHGVAVLKSADSFAYVGDLVTYQIKVYNPSDYDLFHINVTDDMVGLKETIPFMAASNTTGHSYTFQREVLEADPTPVVNTVFVEAIDSQGAYSSASTQAITIITEQLVGIRKTGPESAYKGERIEYSITVNNTGDQDLLGVVVEDEMAGFSWTGDLHRGELNVFNLSYVIPCDADCILTNLASVWAESNETTIYAEDSWTNEILDCCWKPTRSMGYWKNHLGMWPLEDVEVGNVTYTREEALLILKEANAKDATRMLAAQLIAAKLNRFLNACSYAGQCNRKLDIDTIISEADAFLSENPVGSEPQADDRQHALDLKDLLGAYNNHECD